MSFKDVVLAGGIIAGGAVLSGGCEQDPGTKEQTAFQQSSAVLATKMNSGGVDSCAFTTSKGERYIIRLKKSPGNGTTTNLELVFAHIVGTGENAQVHTSSIGPVNVNKYGIAIDKSGVILSTPDSSGRMASEMGSLSIESARKRLMAQITN